MKRFEVYKNIRKRAMIMGLPISLFALMMTAVIGSLLVIIFSFSFGVIISVLLFNVMLYVGLTYFTRNPGVLRLRKVFPIAVSNKKESRLYYEED